MSIDKALEAQDDFLLLCESLESRIGRLYLGLAARFPGHRDFWMRLAEEEGFHAQSIALVRKQAGARGVLVNLSAVSSAGIAALDGLVTNVQKQLEAPALSYRRALQLVLSVEVSLLERGFFRLVLCDMPEYRALANRLDEETRRHLREIARELEKQAAE